MKVILFYGLISKENVFSGVFMHLLPAEICHTFDERFLYTAGSLKLKQEKMFLNKKYDKDVVIFHEIEVEQSTEANRKIAMDKATVFFEERVEHMIDNEKRCKW